MKYLVLENILSFIVVFSKLGAAGPNEKAVFEDKLCYPGVFKVS